MILLQLSSISGGFINFGALPGEAVANPEYSIGIAAFMTALAVPGALAYARADAHWLEIKEPGHFDGVLDDGCARLYAKVSGIELTDEERADLDGTAGDVKETARRLLTSRWFEPMMARIRYQGTARKAITA